MDGTGKRSKRRTHFGEREWLLLSCPGTSTGGDGREGGREGEMEVRRWEVTHTPLTVVSLPFLTRCSMGTDISFWQRAILRKHLPLPWRVCSCGGTGQAGRGASGGERTYVRRGSHRMYHLP